MDRASAAGAPTMAAPINIGMFNLGNAIGAWQDDRIRIRLGVAQLGRSASFADRSDPGIFCLFQFAQLSCS